MLDSVAVQSSIWPLMRLPVLPQLLLHLQQSKLDADLAWVEWAHLVEFDVALSAKVLALRNTAPAVETSADLLSHCITELGEARLHGLIDHVATTQFFSPFNQLADARWLDLWARINLRREFVITLASQLAYPRLDELRLGTLLLGLIEIRTLAATDDVSFAVSPAPDGQSDPFSTQIGNLAELLGVPKKVAPPSRVTVRSGRILPRLSKYARIERSSPTIVGRRSAYGPLPKSTLHNAPPSRRTRALAFAP